MNSARNRDPNGLRDSYIRPAKKGETEGSTRLASRRVVTVDRLYQACFSTSFFSTAFSFLTSYEVLPFFPPCADG